MWWHRATGADFQLRSAGSNNPKQALLGVAVVVLGVPVYHILKKKEYQS
jgi:hypothetical protein